MQQLPNILPAAAMFSSMQATAESPGTIIISSGPYEYYPKRKKIGRRSAISGAEREKRTAHKKTAKRQRMKNRK